MSTSLAVLLTVLSGIHGAAGELSLTHARTTYGVLGPERPDNKIRPGDNLVLSFDIEGATIDADGKLRYSIGMEASSEDGKVLFKQVPRDLDAKVAPGSKKVPACASLQIGVDQPAGNYKLKVTVKDLASGAAAEVTKSYEILPKAFSLVRVTLTSDSDGQVPAAFLAPGKAAFINFTAVEFGRDKTKNQPHLVVVMRVLDSKGKPVLAEPSQGEVTQDVPEKTVAHAMQFALELPKAGKFTIELEATDKITGKSDTVSFPVTVKKTK